MGQDWELRSSHCRAEETSCGARGGFLPRHDEDLREPLVRRQGSLVCCSPWGCIDKLCVEPAGVSRRCMGVSVPLRLVPSPTGLPSKSFSNKHLFSCYQVLGTLLGIVDAPLTMMGQA